jgi:hypothetical protein
LTDTRDRKRKGSPQWIRLGELLTVRRTELDPAYFDRAAFARDRGINLKLAQDIENNARENFTPLTLRDLIARAYGVEYQSVLAALDGGDLVAAPGMPPHKPRGLRPVPSLERGPDDLFPDIDPAIRPDVDRHVPVLNKLVRDAARTGPLTGSRIFPDNPHEAARWDWLAELSLSPWQLIRLMAVGRVRDDERRAGIQPRRVRAD